MRDRGRGAWQGMGGGVGTAMPSIGGLNFPTVWGVVSGGL